MSSAKHTEKSTSEVFVMHGADVQRCGRTNVGQTRSVVRYRHLYKTTWYYVFLEYKKKYMKQALTYFSTTGERFVYRGGIPRRNV